MDQAEATVEGRPQGDRSNNGRWLEWADWRATLILVLGILALRIVYLIWLNPWELVEDEAHYWEWSRRLALSYYSKGPGIATIIAASTWLFGVSEWAIRLPAALSSLIGALVLARLTIDAFGDERAGFLAALSFNLIAIFQFEGQIMTIDPPFMALWLVCAWIAWHAFAAHRRGDSPWLLWALLGLALGAGFLVKYIIVLLPPGLLLYAFIRRRSLPWDRRMTAAVGLALVTFAVALTPWVVWNAQHGWPAIAHELGHLGAPGGDTPPRWGDRHALISMLEMVGSQIGVMGPPAFVLIVLATVSAFRERPRRPDRWPRHLFMLSCAVPTLAFFLLLSLISTVEGNWPVSAYLTLLVLVGERSVVEIPRWFERRKRWLCDARAVLRAGGSPRRKPRSAWVTGWRWMIGWGLVTATIIAWPHGWARLPVIGDALPMDRIDGGREIAAEVDELRRQLRVRTGEEPLVIGGAYGLAGQLAFYLEDRPTVYGADSYLRWRETQYDYWEETDLSDPALRGRPAVMVCRDAEKWLEAFEFETFGTLNEDIPIHVGLGFGGPAPPAEDD